MIDFVSNGVDINVPDDLDVLFKKTQMLRTKFFVITSLVTLLEEQPLPSDLLYFHVQFRLTISQLVKPFKYLTKLSQSLLEPFGFKCKRLLFKCFLGLMVVLLMKGISLLSHKSFK